MLTSFIGKQDNTRWAETWEELGHGAPTLAGYARVCSLALASGATYDQQQLIESLSTEAKTILVAARERGTIEVKGANQAFDAPARLLAVYIDSTGPHPYLFRRKEQPEVTIRFLGGFHELCRLGLVMHHTFAEFSLTRDGFDVARQIDGKPFQADLAWASAVESYPT